MSSAATPGSLGARAAVAAVILAVILGVAWIRRARPPTAAAATTAKELATVAKAQDDTSPRHETPSRAESRRARDAMRAEIVSTLRKRSAVAPPIATAAAAAPSARKDSAGEEDLPHGHYEPSYIREHFREDMFPLLKSCYEGALLRRPALAGKLVLKFAIVGDKDVGGVVESADFADESDLKDTEMETCVRESLMTLTFDKPPTGGGIVNVTYPIAFSPDPDPSEADAGTSGG